MSHLRKACQEDDPLGRGILIYDKKYEADIQPRIILSFPLKYFMNTIE